MDRTKIKSKVKVEVIRGGKKVWEYEGTNILMAKGKVFCAGKIENRAVPGGTSANVSQFGLGSSTTGPTDADTALGAEFTYSGYARPVIGAAQCSIVANAITWRVPFTYTGSGDNLNEIGLWTSDGNLFAHFLTTTYALVGGDVLNLSWQITIG